MALGDRRRESPDSTLVWTGPLTRLNQIGDTSFGAEQDRSFAQISLEASLRRTPSASQAEKAAEGGHYEIDLATGTTVWSNATFRIFGLEPGSEAPNVKAFTAMIHPEDRKPICALISRSILERKRFDLIYRVIRANGEIMFVHSIAGLRQINGRKEMMFGTFRDITESHRATEALRIDEETLHSLLESSNHHIFVLDPNGTFISSNDRVQHLGISSGIELVGRGIAMCCPPNVASLYLSRMDEIRQLRRQTVFEYAASGQNGTTFHRGCLSPIFRNGALWAVGGVSADITEQKIAFMTLAESERKFRVLYEGAPIAYQSVDGHGILLEVNNAWLRLLGYSRAEVVGRPLKKFLDVASRSASIVPNVAVELSMVKKDGSHVVVTIDCRIGFSPDSESKVCHGILRDMTEQKRLEKQLRESQVLLTQRSMEVERKNLALQELIQHLRDSGRDVVSAQQNPSSRTIHIPGELSVLSPRELQVCLHIQRGLSTKEIALQMGISLRSVETHRNHSRRKLHIEGMSLSAYLGMVLGLPYPDK